MRTSIRKLPTFERHAVDERLAISLFSAGGRYLPDSGKCGAQDGPPTLRPPARRVTFV